MRFQNETTDQALCLTRKHPFGDEPNANKVLLPGDSYECAGIYQVEQSYRALTDEERAIVSGRDMQEAAARDATTEKQPPVNLQQHVEMEKAAQQEAKELPPASGSTETEKAGASAEAPAEQVTESPAVVDGVDTSPAPVVGDGDAAAAAEPVAAGETSDAGKSAETMIAEGSPVTPEPALETGPGPVDGLTAGSAVDSTTDEVLDRSEDEAAA